MSVLETIQRVQSIRTVSTRRASCPLSGVQMVIIGCPWSGVCPTVIRRPRQARSPHRRHRHNRVRGHHPKSPRSDLGLPAHLGLSAGGFMQPSSKRRRRCEGDAGAKQTSGALSLLSSRPRSALAAESSRNGNAMPYMMSLLRKPRNAAPRASSLRMIRLYGVIAYRQTGTPR